MPMSRQRTLDSLGGRLALLGDGGSTTIGWLRLAVTVSGRGEVGHDSEREGEGELHLDVVSCLGSLSRVRPKRIIRR